MESGRMRTISVHVWITIRVDVTLAIYGLRACIVQLSVTAIKKIKWLGFIITIITSN